MKQKTQKNYHLKESSNISLYFTGIMAALFATAVWSLNFIIPFVIGDYTIFDFAIFRFVISGVFGVFVLILRRDKVYAIGFSDLLLIACLSFSGYVGFFLFASSSAIYAGPIIAPAILSLVPIVLSISGNLIHGSIPWRSLSKPLILICIGLILVQKIWSFSESENFSFSLLGLVLAFGAVILWTSFGLLNQSALKARPAMDSSVWSAMLLIGGAVELLIFYPIGAHLDLFKIPELGLSWSSASSLWMWGTSLAFISSVAGGFAWTIAARSLPVALSAQLVVCETIFGVFFGLIVHKLWPTFLDLMGLVILITGVIIAIKVFYGTEAKPNATTEGM